MRCCEMTYFSPSPTLLMTIRITVEPAFPGQGRCLEFVNNTSPQEIKSQLESLYHFSPTFLIKNTNKPLDSVSSLASITTLQAVFSLRGGKGGFGANLRAKKAKNSKNQTQSRTYYKDLKTGAKLKDLQRLKLAVEILLKKSALEQEERQEVECKKEKLRKSIEYYESILEGKSTDGTKFEDTEFLEVTDKLMNDLRDNMVISLQSLEVDSDSDWESESETPVEQPKEKPTGKPKFAKFFDESDSE